MSYVHVTKTRGHDLGHYARVVDALGSEPVSGRLHHEVGEEEGSLCVLDVWEDRAAAERFAADRLFPAFAAAGVQPQETQFITFEAASRG